MPWTYKKVLVIGATSGIGEALAARLVTAGSNVILTGRRKDKLEQLVLEHGKDKSSAKPLDITNIDEIPHFAQKFVSLCTRSRPILHHDINANVR